MMLDIAPFGVKVKARQLLRASPCPPLPPFSFCWRRNGQMVGILLVFAVAMLVLAIADRVGGEVHETKEG